MKGRLIVYSGPSGVGKGHVKELFIHKPELKLHFSVSATTRAPREKEVDGKHYHFISQETFNQWIAEDKFLEWAEFVGNKYGTPRQYVEKILNEGNNVILEIEILGVEQVVKHMPEAVTIWLAPPSLEELERRLRQRGTDSEEAIQGRIERARQEIEEAKGLFKYTVINDVAKEAALEISNIIERESNA